jgi:hypothetical protein
MGFFASSGWLLYRLVYMDVLCLWLIDLRLSLILSFG